MNKAAGRRIHRVASADEAVALLDENQPKHVTLLAHEGVGPDVAGTYDPGGSAVTIVLDRLLAATPPDERRRAWPDAVDTIVRALHDLTSLAVSEVGLSRGMLVDALTCSPRLTRLSLRDCAIDDAGAGAIADLVSGLTVLDLASNRIGATGAAVLVDRLRQLTHLDLSDNEIGEEGATAIVEWPPGLLGLNLRGCGIGDLGVVAIVARRPGLVHLCVAGNKIRDGGAQSIAEYCRNLVSLDLADNGVGDDGVSGIATRLTQLTELDLAGNRVSDGGALLIGERLHRLVDLDLRDNHIGDDGADAIAANLERLVRLDLLGTRISKFGALAIARELKLLTDLGLGGLGIGSSAVGAIASGLPRLTALHLSGNGIGDEGAEVIAQGLPHLQRLDLVGNRIGVVGARSIAAGLSELVELRLAGNQVGDGGAAVIAEGLSELRVLGLADNRISDRGASAIALLTKLTDLNLADNLVGESGVQTIAAALPNLGRLDLRGNQIDDDGVGALVMGLARFRPRDLDRRQADDDGARHVRPHVHLTHLDLERNRIGDDGARRIAAHFPSLTEVGLADNEVGNDGARALAEGLPNLTSLDLANNGVGEEGVRSVLDALAFDAWGRTRRLGLAGNPGVGAIGLPELASSADAPALLAAYRRLRGTGEADKVAFGEAKLVVLGNEAVGKTSLVRALVDGERAAPDESRTAGVNHRIWVTPWAPSEEGKTQLNIWDFGGQEIMHQTHQYFLSERCIHLVVLSSRLQDDTSVYTWLDTIRHRAPESPVIVVVNKCDDGTHNLDVDFERLRVDHPEIVDVFNVSCAPDPEVVTLDGTMAPLHDCLAQLLTDDERLSSVRVRVPKAWVRVRDEVRGRARDMQVLGVDEFVNLCQMAADAALRVTDPDDQRALLRLLHQIGAVVAHGLTDQTRTLAGLTLLDPNWFTTAVYALLDYGMHEFDRHDLGERLRKDSDRASLYPDERLGYIIDLLQQPEFALAFRLPGDVNPPRYLLPEALTPESPASLIAGWDPGSLRFRYRYQNLPRGLIPRFQVISHEHAGPHPARWRAGCTLEVQGCPVLVDGKIADGVVDILVAGPASRRRYALAVVRSLFDVIHLRIPESSAMARVPLPDHPTVDVGYDYLLELEEQYGSDRRIPPEGATREYAVSELLDGVRTWQERDQAGRSGIVNDVTGSVTINQIAGDVDRAVQASTIQPTPPVVVTTPGDDRTGRAADGAQLGGAIGAALGCAGAALYLLGQGKGWPLEAFLAGGGVGTIVGGVLGAIAGRVTR